MSCSGKIPSQYYNHSVYRKNRVKQYADFGNRSGIGIPRDNRYFVSINTPAPINYSMGRGVHGSYSNIKLGDGYLQQTRKEREGRFYVPQGSPMPLPHEEKYHTIPDDSMFLFAKNDVSPYCCPSTFSSSNGCVCATAEQIRYVSQLRGNNKNFPSDSF